MTKPAVSDVESPVQRRPRAFLCLLPGTIAFYLLTVTSGVREILPPPSPPPPSLGEENDRRQLDQRG